MTEYRIQKGADGRVATDPTGYNKQRADILVATQSHGGITTERQNHLLRLLTAMDEIPENQLPKTIEIPD